MRIALIMSGTDIETVWNAFRYGVFALKQGDQVKAFLLAKGVEAESLGDEKFKVTEQMRALVDGGGGIYACGTCLKIRNSNGSELCPLSTMKDMYEIIKETDKVLTF